MKVPAARGVVGRGARVPAVPASMNVDGRMCCFTISQVPLQQRLDAFGRMHGAAALMHIVLSEAGSRAYLVSHKVFLKSFRKSQSQHKSVNLFFIPVLVKDKLANFWGS